ncbi:MAG: hypothetical protein JW749_13015 [Sedimentisphaerales bacterium]|nr:hypothetical protein [Sedimentisphaerales bacterium]
MCNRNLFLSRLQGVLPVFTALLLITCRPGVGLSANTYNDIGISLNTPASEETFHGYVEYGVLVTNSSETATHSVSLVAPKSAYSGYGNYIERLSRTVVVPPSSSVTVPFLQPPVMVRGSDIEVTIDGRRQREAVPFHSRHCTSYSGYYSGSAHSPRVSVLLSRNVSFDDFEKGIENAYSSGAAGAWSRHPDRCSFIKAEVPVTEWNTGWLAYSCYDGIVVSAEDMRIMPTPVRAAVLHYLQVGGTLLVLDSWEPPEGWLTVRGKEGLFDLRYVGFGMCVINQKSSRDTDCWDNDKFKFLKEQVWSPTASAMISRKSVSDTNVWFPVVATLAMPIRGLFLLVLCFAIVIGPANLLILSRKNRRIWMLWTAPLLSIVASLAVIFYAFFAEGWRGHVRIQAITILDEASHRAGTVAISAFYCPLTPRGGLHFDYETELTPLGTESYREGTPKSIDWTADQHLSSGWMSARVPAHFLVRKNQMRRERVKITGDGSSVEALNGLGAEIKRLWYSDGQGRIYEAENIAAGAKVALMAGHDSLLDPPNPDALRKVFSSGWLSGYNELSRLPHQYLRPNTYIAVLEDTPFVEQPLKNPKSRNLKSVVIGFLGEPADAG